MKLTKCEQCGGPTAEGLPLCPDCMRATGAAADQIAAAEELRDIARVLSITANTDANIREAIVGMASRLLRVSGTKKESASNVDGICLPAAGTVLHCRKPVRRTGTTLRPLRRRGQPDDMRNDIRRDTGNADRHRIRIYL